MDNNLERLRRPVGIIIEATQTDETIDSYQFKLAVEALNNLAPTSLKATVYSERYSDREPISDQEWRQILVEEPFMAKIEALLTQS